MSSVRLSIQDRKDLEKFTKFLALKAAQIIVQSRLGEKVQSKCKPHSGTDWFNLAIQDLPEVYAEAKKALCSDLVNTRLPMCVEISLRTVEGEAMMLETWCLGVLPDQCDPTVRVTYTVYNRMCVLLKSLLSVTRVTPAYKLSRRQGPDTYVICYRIYTGEPQFQSLGDGYKQLRVGQLCTPVGTIQLTVSYRTKLTISPQHTGRDTSIMLKSDHFHPDLSPRHGRHQQQQQQQPQPEEGSGSLSATIRVGAFAEAAGTMAVGPVMACVPFSSLLGPTAAAPPQAPLPPLPPPANGNVTPLCPSGGDSRHSSCSLVSAADDFIMVDLKTPFAGNNANSDLGTFYRECQSAPQLKAFSEQPTLAEQVAGIARTLELLEGNMHEYDDMLNSLCLTENNN